MMPNANGFDTLLRLKEIPETAAIPIIVVSVLEQKRMGFALGAAEYLVEPVDKTRLIETIQKFVRSKAGGDVPLLLVDDDPAALELLETTLRSAGYSTRTATHGGAALEILSRSPVSAVFVDLLMPGMDGFELIRQIKKRPEVRGKPIFVLTAKQLTADEVALLSRETEALFDKDGSWTQELLTALHRSIHRNRRALAAGHS